MKALRFAVLLAVAAVAIPSVAQAGEPNPAQAEALERLQVGVEHAGVGGVRRRRAALRERDGAGRRRLAGRSRARVPRRVPRPLRDLVSARAAARRARGRRGRRARHLLRAERAWRAGARCAARRAPPRRLGHRDERRVPAAAAGGNEAGDLRTGGDGGRADGRRPERRRGRARRAHLFQRVLDHERGRAGGLGSRRVRRTSPGVCRYRRASRSSTRGRVGS